MADNFDNELADAIKQAGWWQGSILPEASIKNIPPSGIEDGWWVVASQTCNLYSPNFTKIPVFELVAAKKIDILDKAFCKGNNPRILHVEAIGNGETAYFEIDIQKRAWVERATLASLAHPAFEIIDAHRDTENWNQNQWLDNFAGWISRSYTRVTLPDDFNSILKESKIQAVLDSKLRNNALYGIYFSISPATHETWAGNLGMMPPPYLLEILLVTEENQDPDLIVSDLKTHIFDKKLQFTLGDLTINASRAEASKHLGLTIIPASITGKNIAETTLLEIKSHIRYTLNDFLSRSEENVD